MSKRFFDRLVSATTGLASCLMIIGLLSLDVRVNADEPVPIDECGCKIPGPTCPSVRGTDSCPAERFCENCTCIDTVPLGNYICD